MSTAIVVADVTDTAPCAGPLGQAFLAILMLVLTGAGGCCGVEL
jgi:hypothetical protein